MRRISLLAVLSFSAFAAGSCCLSAEALPPKPNFTGFQTGILVGGNIARTKVRSVAMRGLAVSPVGWQAGFQLGYGKAFGKGMGCPFVGLDGAYLQSWASDRLTYMDNGQPVAMLARQKNSFWVGPRFGMTFGNALPFVRAGYTQARFTSKYTYPGIPDQKMNHMRKGYVIGAGVDVLVKPSFVLGVSYGFSDLGEGKKPHEGAWTEGKVKYKSHSVLLNIAYKG